MQYGVPLRVLVNKFSHTRFEPMGHTSNPDIRIAKSLVDYIFRWLDLTFQSTNGSGRYPMPGAKDRFELHRTVMATANGKVNGRDRMVMRPERMEIATVTTNGTSTNGHAADAESVKSNGASANNGSVLTERDSLGIGQGRKQRSQLPFSHDSSWQMEGQGDQFARFQT